MSWIRRTLQRACPNGDGRLVTTVCKTPEFTSASALSNDHRSRGINMNTKLIAVSATFLTLLAGCGGGGGGGSPSPQASTGAPAGGSTGTPAGTGTGGTTTPPVNGSTGPVVPIEQAMINLYTAGKTFNRTTVIGGDSYVVMATYANAGVANFEGAATTRETVSRNVTKNGAAFYSSDQSDYFETAPSFKIDGRVVAGQAASYYVTSPTGFTKLPATGKPGDAGQFYTATVYDSAAKNVMVGTATQSWTVAGDTDTTNVFCINLVLTIGSNTTKQADCYKISTSGEIPSVLFSTPNTSTL